MGRDTAWYIFAGESEIETYEFDVQCRRGNEFVIDIKDSKMDSNLLVQAGFNGYQIDAWWDEDNCRKTSVNWVNFGETKVQNILMTIRMK